MSAASAPPGGGAVASAVAPWWPQLDPAVLDGIAQFYQSWASHLGDAADTSDAVYKPWFGELLVGQAGDALQTSHNTNVNGWRNDAAQYHTAAVAVTDAANDLQGLQNELIQIISVYEPAYETAISKHDGAAANQILAEAEYAAQGAATFTAARIFSVLDGKFGTASAGTNNGGTNVVLTSYQQGGYGGQGLPGLGGMQNGSGVPATDAAYGQPDTFLGQTQPATPISSGEPSSSGAPAGSGGSPSSGAPAGSGGSPSSSGAPVGSGEPSSSSGGPAGSGGSPSSSGGPAGSGGSPSSSGAPAGSGGSPGPPISSGVSAPVSSGIPRSSSGQNSDQSSGGPTAPAGDGSGTGVPSGMGTPGAVQSVPLFGHGQPGAGGLPAHGIAGGGAQPWYPVASSDGGGAGVSGGGMMPMAPAPGPLAPYSPPGAGLSSSTPPASTPGAPTGAPALGPAAGGGAVIAASRAGKSTGAAPTTQVNPDLDSAQRVLTGLVKACPAQPIFWAVSVLRTPVGPQTLIAGSVGGGAYLPAEVSVPSTVGLAVLDPTLPSGWAAAWMGWQCPLAILVDHYERVAKVVAGVTVSAMVTSELWPSPPDCGGDFLAVRHEELVTSTVPPLAGGHRLTATDPVLAARLMALDRGGDITNFVAAQLTRAVWTAAAQPDDTGLPIAVKEDADILELVATGAATAEHWADYRREVERRADGAVMMPEIHAPRDADDSPGSVTARMWYRHYYARGRIAEMVTCWASQPVSILDIAYCGVAAGFGAMAAAVVTELEKQVPKLPGSEGGRR